MIFLDAIGGMMKHFNWKIFYGAWVAEACKLIVFGLVVGVVWNLACNYFDVHPAVRGVLGQCWGFGVLILVKKGLI